MGERKMTTQGKIEKMLLQVMDEEWQNIGPVPANVVYLVRERSRALVDELRSMGFTAT